MFQIGALDQGYWPDGIYTAPTDEALKYDIEAAKKLGFNLLRKHAKVEPQRWYYWTDKLGVLVWQDMPQMFGGKEGRFSHPTAFKRQFETEWRRIIAEFFNVPSSSSGRRSTRDGASTIRPSVAALTRQLDPSRLVNSASGWVDMKAGDIDDVHAYPGPGRSTCRGERPSSASLAGSAWGSRATLWAKTWGYQGVYSRDYPLTRITRAAPGQL